MGNRCLAKEGHVEGTAVAEQVRSVESNWASGVRAGGTGGERVVNLAGRIAAYAASVDDASDARPRGGRHVPEKSHSSAFPVTGTVRA